MVLSTKQHATVIAVSAASIGFTVGSCFGWTSPMESKLTEMTPDSPLNVKITPDEMGWVGSLIALGAALITCLTIPLADTLGRKIALILFAICLPISYGLLIIANEVWYIYVARFIQGLASGAIADLVPVYIVEISPDDIRGKLCSIMSIFITCGIIYSYILGPHIDYIIFQYCLIGLPIPFFATFIFMPESPYFYALKGRGEELNKSLICLHGKNDVKVEEERAKIQKNIDDSLQNSGRIIDIFRNKQYRKLIFITCGLMFFHHMSGTLAVTLYCQDILEDAGTVWEPGCATIVVGFLQLQSNLCTPFLIDYFGRKKILYVSSIGMALPLLTIGTYFHYKSDDETMTSVLPPICLYVFKVFFGIGFGPVPWAMLGEMFPPNIKRTAIATTSTFSWIVSFIILKIFPVLHEIGEFHAFYIFGGSCVVSLFFVKFFVIETKGLSLQMIQEKVQGEAQATN